MNLITGDYKNKIYLNLTRVLLISSILILLIATLSGSALKLISPLIHLTYSSGLLMLITLNLGLEKKPDNKLDGYYKYIFVFGIAVMAVTQGLELYNDYLGPASTTIMNNILISTYFNSTIIALGIIIIFKYHKEIENNGKEVIQVKDNNLHSYRSNIIFLFIIIVFFFTRLYATDFINGSDNYNVLGIKNLYENGISYYKYSSISDQLMLWSVKLFGFNFFSIKIPFIIYSFITLLFLYLIAAMISKPLALLTAFLYAISPWAIIQSNITRDYSFDLMIATIVIYISLFIYKIIYELEQKNHSIYLIFMFCLSLLLIFYIYNNIRVQTLITGLFVLVIGIASLNRIIIKVPQLPIWIKKSYWALILLPLIIVTYRIQRFPFEMGFQHPDSFFFKVFFDPGISSPWQWFHNSGIHILFIFFIFTMGLTVVAKNDHPFSSDLLLILYLSFISGIALFAFKFESHLAYIPVRYVYFLFAPYVIILANGIMNILKPFSGIFKYLIIVSLIIFINYQALLYSINPRLAFEKEGIATLAIDNINIGRFDLLKVIDYLENELDVTDDTILVFDGRYEEFILYMDRPMDEERCLLRPSNNKCYEIAKNTYVQSAYFGYKELFQAINHKSGKYITDSSFIYDPSKLVKYPLDENNFIINNIELEYITTINGFKIYSW